MSLKMYDRCGLLQLLPKSMPITERREQEKRKRRGLMKEFFPIFQQLFVTQIFLSNIESPSLGTTLTWRINIIWTVIHLTRVFKWQSCRNRHVWWSKKQREYWR
jgi:hypothetical protein